MAQGINFEMGFGRSRGVRSDEPGVLNVVVLGAFSGNVSAPQGELAKRALLKIDIDNFDRVLARLKPTLTIAEFAGAPVSLNFESLDDFHPDALFKRFEPLSALRALRAKLTNPATFEEAARQLEAAPEPVEAPPSDAAAPQDLFSSLLGQPVSIQPAAQARPASSVDRLIGALVKPHLQSGIDQGRQQALLSALDQAIGDTLRQLLHRPEFQALEAAWRGVHWLINQVQAEEAVRIQLFDTRPAELLADWQASGGQSAASQLALRWVDPGELRATDGNACLLVDSFGSSASADSLAILEHLGNLAGLLNAVVISGGDQSLLGLSGGEASDAATYRRGLPIAPDWQAFRACGAARCVGLAWPRVVARLPYGRDSDPVDAFQFEEIPGTPRSDDYLWGSAGVLIAGILIGAFGDGEGIGDPALQVGDLPCHVYAGDEGKTIWPATEVLLGEAGIDAVLAAGLMPISGSTRFNGVRVARLQTCASSPADLMAVVFGG